MEPPVQRREPKVSRPVNHPHAELLYQWPETLAGDNLTNVIDLTVNDAGDWIALRVIEDPSMLFQSILLLVDPVSYQSGVNMKLVKEARRLQRATQLYDVNRYTLEQLGRLLGVGLSIYNRKTGRWTTVDGSPMLYMIYQRGLIQPLVYYHRDRQTYQTKF